MVMMMTTTTMMMVMNASDYNNNNNNDGTYHDKQKSPKYILYTLAREFSIHIRIYLC